MIIYLHGFNSTGPDSGKFNDLKKGLPDIDVYAPTYPSNDPDKAIQIVSKFIEDHQADYDELMLVGTSMGGYFAQYLGRKYNAKVVLINPALNPTETLKRYIGENTNFYTGEDYTLTKSRIDAFAKYNIDEYLHMFGTLVLLDTEDEIVDYKDALDRYAGNSKVVVYAGGNHRFAHITDALPQIKDFYYSMWS